MRANKAFVMIAQMTLRVGFPSFQNQHIMHYKLKIDYEAPHLFFIPEAAGEANIEPSSQFLVYFVGCHSRLLAAQAIWKDHPN